jgi:multiple sugar transport system permease protein
MDHETPFQPTITTQKTPFDKFRRYWDTALYPYVLLAPAVLVLVILILYPVLSAVDLSFREVSLVQAGRSMGPFTLQNYSRLFKAEDLVNSLRVSVIYVAVVTFFAYAIGMGTALLLNERFRGRRLARLMIVIPWAIPLVVATNIFWWIFNRSFGVANYFLVSLNVLEQPIDWFLNPTAALIAVCVTTIWKGYPFFTIMLLAAMQAIPTELYDAAKVDGASARHRFVHITLPAVQAVTGIALLINALWVFREFTVIFVLTGGGPVRATRTLSIWTYLEAFANFNMGYAAAIGMLTLVISVIASIFFVRMTAHEFYE